MGRYWTKLTSFYDREPQWVATLAGTALLGLLTGIDALLGHTSAFRPLFLLPIWLATRMGGRLSGLGLVLLSTFIGTASEWQMGHAEGETMLSNLVIRFAALTFLMLLIAQIEQAVAKHQRLALRDPLTGLLNRHALKQFAESAFDRALLRQLPMTVVVIDCDGFKQLNDTFGHSAGDQVLTMLAKELEEHTRQTDIVARIGGDEFAVVLQDTTVDEASRIMRRVDDSFVASTISKGYPTGLSIGYATNGHGNNELRAALEVADRSMYQHKLQKRTAASMR